MTIENEDYKCYENDLSLPKKPKKPFLLKNADSRLVKIYAEELEQYEKEMEVYKKEMDKYRKRGSELHEKFVSDLFKMLGIQNHPKARPLFHYVWDRTNHYPEVVDHMEELSDFLMCPYCQNKH